MLKSALLSQVFLDLIRKSEPVIVRDTRAWYVARPPSYAQNTLIMLFIYRK